MEHRRITDCSVQDYGANFQVKLNVYYSGEIIMFLLYSIDKINCYSKVITVV